MSTPDNADDVSNPDVDTAEDYGTLTVEDDPQGTTDPAELAGTAGDSDADVS